MTRTLKERIDEASRAYDAARLSRAETEARYLKSRATADTAERAYEVARGRADSRYIALCDLWRERDASRTED